jgi:hypothetical protein
MKTDFPKALVFALGVAGLSACGGPYLEAEEPQVCQSVPFHLPGSPAGQTSTASLSQNLNLPEIPADPRIQVSLLVNSIRFEAQAGSPDLGFIDDLKLTADNGEADCNQVTLMKYKNESGENVQDITSGGSEQNLFNCILPTHNASNRKLAVNLMVTGRLPSPSATLGMSSCFSAKLRLN